MPIDPKKAKLISDSFRQALGEPSVDESQDADAQAEQEKQAKLRALQKIQAANQYNQPE